ncbi:hypothetical protein F5144DRAFT_236898 [Chaetomium tenue]|uniref:Uncharacterized protein n=1 Tax=Chaetomium tenue TaxID=1854479 RepID=A0ACB7P6Z8_9PEZI|nr:hypothetical protein F5144DRAFT_236898 [Chaetomium globosum]
MALLLRTACCSILGQDGQNKQTNFVQRPRHYRASRGAASCLSLEFRSFPSFPAHSFPWYGFSKTGTGPMPQLSCADPELSGIPSFISGPAVPVFCRFQTRNWAFVNTESDFRLHSWRSANGRSLISGEGANPSTLRRKVPTRKPPCCLYRIKLARFEAKSGLLLPRLGPANSGYSTCSRQLFVVDFRIRRHRLRTYPKLAFPRPWCFFFIALRAGKLEEECQPRLLVNKQSWALELPTHNFSSKEDSARNGP